MFEAQASAVAETALLTDFVPFSSSSQISLALQSPGHSAELLASS